MPGPLVTSALINLGSAGLGYLGDRFLNPKPDPRDLETPDYTDQFGEVANIRRSILSNRLQDQRQDVEDEIAAAGLTGSAAAAQRTAQMDAANDASRQLNADIANAMRRARMAEEQAEFGLERAGYRQDLQRSRNRSQGIGRVVSGVGQLGSNIVMDQMGGGNQTSGVDTFMENPFERTRFDADPEFLDPLEGNYLQGYA